MRSNLDNNKGQGLDIDTLRLGVVRPLPLTADFTIPSSSPVFYFIDPGSADRIITLPAFKRGLIHGVAHIGAAHTLTVKDSSGTTLMTLTNVMTALFVCSGNEWKVFTAAVGDALDPTEISSPDGSLTVTVVGGAVQLTVNAGGIDHNALLNYVANQHIDHTAVTLTAGAGLAGGGNIAASRTFSLDLNSLTGDTPVLGDSFAFYDLSGGDTNKATFTTLNGILDHNSLLNYVANQHIDHTSVSIQAGAGLTGGGTIAATRTLSIDITSQTADTIAGADELLFWDISGGDLNKTTVTNFLNVFWTANGMVARTAAGTFAARTITAPAAGLTISNGDGVAGNPTWSLANDLSAVEGLAANGIATRTATDTWTVRTITGTTNKITVTNGDGVSGNPTLTVGSTVLQTDTSATIAVGFNATSFSGGTVTGANQTYTPTYSNGNIQHITLNGSSLTGTFTFAVPSAASTQIVTEVTNGGSGAVGATLSTSGYDKVDGTYATTNGSKFLFVATRTQNYKYLRIVPLQ